MKMCSKCKLEKTNSEFYKASWCSDGLRPDCKQCNIKKSSIRQKKRRKTNPETFRNTALKAKYGVSLEQYRIKLAAQGNVCKICGSSNPGASKKLFSVDHNHKTGQIRGILCHGCNAGLGMFREDPISLQNAIKYLKDYNG